MSRILLISRFGATSPTCKLYYAVTASGLFALSWDGQLGRDPRIASEGLFGHARENRGTNLRLYCCHRADGIGYGT
jgi:hypothetical protein